MTTSATDNKSTDGLCVFRIDIASAATLRANGYPASADYQLRVEREDGHVIYMDCATLELVHEYLREMRPAYVGADSPWLAALLLLDRGDCVMH